MFFLFYIKKKNNSEMITEKEKSIQSRKRFIAFQMS